MLRGNLNSDGDRAENISCDIYREHSTCNIEEEVQQRDTTFGVCAGQIGNH